MRLFSLSVSVKFNRISLKMFYDQLYIKFRVTVCESFTINGLPGNDLLAMNDIAKLNGTINNFVAMNYLVTLNTS